MKKHHGYIFILHTSTINQNHTMYDSWDTECDIIFSHFGPFFAVLHFFPLTTQRIKSLKKWIKNPTNIIILHKCTLNDNHIIYGSWDINCNRQIFLSSWSIFCTFNPQTPKNENIKKWKTTTTTTTTTTTKCLEISLFYKSVPKIMIIG